MVYVWQSEGWPVWRLDPAAVLEPLAAVRMQQGELLGRMRALGLDLRMQAELDTVTETVVATSRIEGDVLDATQVRSSIARQIGVDVAGVATTDRNVDGIVQVTLDAAQRFAAPLTAERLFGWHAALFPTGFSGLARIEVGAWRTDARGPMQIVSGPLGRERVHFEAPPASSVASEMQKFLDWFEAGTQDWVIRAALAHLWFVTVHPFDDGNGRIGRAITDLALARSERIGQRFYSMSSSIGAQRLEYYEVLKQTQRGDGDATAWVLWFLGRLGEALAQSHITIGRVLRKADFWQAYTEHQINERQRKVLNLLLDGTFVGALSSSTYARITKTSQDTAARDLAALAHLGILRRGSASGRSTHYSLAEQVSDTPDER